MINSFILPFFPEQVENFTSVEVFRCIMFVYKIFLANLFVVDLYQNLSYSLAESVESCEH